MSLLNPSAFIVFGVNIDGPYIHYSDVTPKFEKNITGPLEDFLMKLAISCISTLGFGQEYQEGTFELPSFGIPDHRLILIAVDNTEQTILTHKDHIDYFQIAIYVPNKDMKHLRTMITIEEEMISYFKRIAPCIKNINQTQFKKIRKDVLILINSLTVET